jgi:branched-chain amino acid transport system ATP-binding protein
MNDTLLAVDGLVAGYGESIILEGVSIELAARGSLALLGRNGVGKTTLIASLLGLTRIHRGTVVFAGSDVTAWRPYARAHAGMGWIPQERDIFPSLTVQENLTVIARPGPWTLKRVYALFPRLDERSRNMGNQLSGGEQQMLAIGRALMGNPRVLLLDEPSEGLAPLIVAEVGRTIRRLKEEGQSIVLVEQNIKLALDVADQAVILNTGRCVFAGNASDILNNEELIAQNLGVVHAH